jgi:hypothetical protein
LKAVGEGWSASRAKGARMFDDVPHSNSYRPTVSGFDEFVEEEREAVVDEDEEE